MNKKKVALPHWLVKDRLYRIWYRMKSRCEKKNDIGFHNYGGRGIKICKKWLKLDGFKDDVENSYIEHKNEFGEENTQIDRVNNNGNYEMANCRWATRKEQTANQRSNRFITYKGETKILFEWSRKYKIAPALLSYRINRGWGIDKALNTPVRFMAKRQSR